MSNVARIQPQGAVRIGNTSFTVPQLGLIKQTAAKDCNEVEFDQFMHVCGHMGLDPMRKQAYALVYNKDDAAKRQMNIIIGIDGYRTIAARTGNYRPDNRPPRFTIDESIIDADTNPQGIVDVTVSVFLFSHGEWHEVPHTVEWEAFAPIINTASDDDWEWVDTGEKWPDSGKPKKKKVLKEGVTKSRKLDPRKPLWRSNGRGMLSKCGEVGAIRKAFPDAFSGVYAQEEFDRTQSIDLSASEWAEAAAVQSRLERVNGAGVTILFDFIDERGLHPVPIGKVHDECESFLRKNENDPQGVDIWWERNKHGLNDFWARAKSDALDIKARAEAIIAKGKAP